MSETWRFIIVITLLVCVGGLLPFAANEAFNEPDAPATTQGGGNG